LGGRERIYVKTYKDFVSVLIEQGQQSHFADSVGLMGAFQYGVQLSRDGKRVLTDANVFGQEWQVLDTNPTLFQTARFPQYPQKCTMPTVLPRLPPRCVVDCVFDVLTTGDLEMAEAGAY
jgi:hypothetical protein